jgi:hypothetical protein
MFKLITSSMLVAMLATAATASASLRDQLVGEYQGNAGGWEYSTGEFVYYDVNYDGVNNAYVSIQAGTADDEVLISNLVPTGFSYLKSIGPLRGKLVEPANFQDYIACIEVESQEAYLVSDSDQGYFARGWYVEEEDGEETADWYSAPYESALIYINADYSISLANYGWGVYVYDEEYGYYSVAYGGSSGDKLMKVGTAPSTDTAFRDKFLGKYTGLIGGTEYLVNYGSSFEFTYDGTENQYVQIVAGEGDDDVVIKNLIPTSYTAISAGDIPAKLYAYDGYDGYQGYIEVQPQKIGSMVYYGYTLDAWFGAAWNSTDYCSGPTEAAYFYIANDGSIVMNFTGWTVYMDYNSDQTTYYPGFCTGYKNDTLTPVSLDGVKAIESVDEGDAPAVYYNFNGVRVDGDNLLPGMYIKRQGNKSVKVLVK